MTNVECRGRKGCGRRAWNDSGRHAERRRLVHGRIRPHMAVLRWHLSAAATTIPRLTGLAERGITTYYDLLRPITTKFFLIRRNETGNERLGRIKIAIKIMIMKGTIEPARRDGGWKGCFELDFLRGFPNFCA